MEGTLDIDQGGIIEEKPGKDPNTWLPLRTDSRRLSW